MKTLSTNQIFGMLVLLMYSFFVFILFNKVDGDSLVRDVAITLFILIGLINHYLYARYRKIFWALLIIATIYFIFLMYGLYQYYCCFTYEIGEL